MRSLSLNSASVLVLVVGASLSLGGARLAAGASPVDACTILPKAQVGRIVGNDGDIARHTVPAARNGVTSSACVFQGSGNTGFITVSTFESNVAAQAHLTAYAEKSVTAGGKTEPDTVGGVAASLVTSAGGSAQLFVIKDNVLLGAGVTTRRKGATTPLPDRARDLATAALAKL